MSEPILHREEIARQAESAVLWKQAVPGRTLTNPYPAGSDAAAAWDATVRRYEQDLVDGEASA